MGFAILAAATFAFVPCWLVFMVFMAESGTKVDGVWLLPLMLDYALFHFSEHRRAKKHQP